MAQYGSKELNLTSVGSNKYTFSMPSADVKVSAAFKIKTFEITWKIDDTEEKETYEYNQTPAHKDPQKEGTPKYTYIFKGWDKQITPATENKTYTAIFEEIKTNALFSKLSWRKGGRKKTSSGEETIYGHLLNL